MTKLVSVMIAVVALSALNANAIIITDPNQGALKMKLTIDATGNATLKNVSAAALGVDSYEIWSASSNLDPVAWSSITDQAASNFMLVFGSLGVGGLSYGELLATAGLLSEGNLANVALFQPNAPFAIGAPGKYPVPSKPDITFYYTMSQAYGGVAGNKYLGVLQDDRPVVPEPATMGLLAFGGISMLLRRKR